MSSILSAICRRTLAGTVSLTISLTLASCVGTTGGDAFSFNAYARGPSTADGGSYSFALAAHGYDVTLTRARVRVGAVYLNRSVATSVSSNTVCTLSGVYGVQVIPNDGGFVVDALSPVLQPFPLPGAATSDSDFTGEVWLNAGDVNEPDSQAVILDVAGTATKAGAVYPFAGTLTIGANRVEPGSDAAPGLHPICKQRIVSPISVNITPARGGSLVLAIDPARMFADVDFADLQPGADGAFHFDDSAETAEHVVDNASKSLYAGLHATTAYQLFWNNP